MKATIESLGDLLAFVTVVEQGTFTAASRVLDLPKSSVSRRVARLESRLGVRLLHRTTRSNTLTSAGEIYFAEAVESLQRVNEVQHQIVSFSEEPQGRLRVTSPSGFLKQTGDYLGSFLNRYPKVRLELVETDRYVDLIDEGFDLAFRGGSEPNPSLDGVRLQNPAWVVAASDKYLTEHGEPESLADLAEHRCLVLGTKCRTTWSLKGRRTNHELKINGRVSANNLQTLQHLVESHLGIGLLPEGACARNETEGIRRLFPEYEAGHAELWLLYPKGGTSNPALAAFVEFSREWIWEGTL